MLARTKPSYIQIHDFENEMLYFVLQSNPSIVKTQNFSDPAIFSFHGKDRSPSFVDLPNWLFEVLDEEATMKEGRRILFQEVYQVQEQVKTSNTLDEMNLAKQL